VSSVVSVVKSVWKVDIHPTTGVIYEPRQRLGELYRLSVKQVQLLVVTQVVYLQAIYLKFCHSEPALAGEESVFLRGAG